MPFVRYARDRRGYETLYVMHAFEGAEKSPRVRVLYACRTVPHAKVGRHTLDEGVQRRIEQAYPALRFEWSKLLKEAAASAPRPERPDPRAAEPRGKARRKGRGAEGAERAERAEPDVPRVPQVPKVPQVRFEVPQVPIPVHLPAEPGTEPGEPMEPGEPVEPQVQVPPPGPLMVDPSWPVVGLIGAERALILRGRYIEIAHRVLSRSGPGDRDRLLHAAARLNPESWTTDEDARAGVAGFDAALQRIAEQLRQPPPL